jgi:Tfp pilus assembly protein PilZ
MKSEENIEKLFESEDLPVRVERQKSMPLISLEAKNPEPNADGIERRQFTRADIADRKLELKFSNSAQFAKQYIENISLGGLFVRTEEKRRLGEIVPIEFSIPTNGSPKTFQLMGKVCRVTMDGVGLEFIHTSRDLQESLESFVKSALPNNVPLVNKPKASAIDTLDRLRSERRERSKERLIFFKKIGVIALLLFLNGYLLTEVVQEQTAYTAFKNHAITVKNRTVPISDIRSLERNQRNQFVLRLNDKSEIEVRPDQIEY